MIVFFTSPVSAKEAPSEPAIASPPFPHPALKGSLKEKSKKKKEKKSGCPCPVAKKKKCNHENAYALLCHMLYFPLLKMLRKTRGEEKVCKVIGILGASFGDGVESVVSFSDVLHLGFHCTPLWRGA